MRRIVGISLSLAITLGLFAGGVFASKPTGCHPARKCPTPSASVVVTPSPTVTPVPTATPRITPQPTAAPLPSDSPYTFDDEFNGAGYDSRWIRHYSCCGTLAGYDSSLATVGNGLLSISAVHRSDGWYSYLLDTKTTFTQKYGYFEARMKIPKGVGLWPAFWGYHDSDSAEIDTMEVCANPLGTNGGNDASLLHTTIHWSGGQAGKAIRTADLSLGFHTYASEWRQDHIAFFIDGVEVWRYTDASHVPAVALPLIVNLGVGGSWCGAPDSTTPSPAVLQVDWIRVKP